MRASHSTLPRLVLVLFALLVSVAGAVYPAGQREDPIEEARALVIEGQLNQAILVLQEAVREDPERIQEAERLLDRIRRIRGDYNELFDELIENLINNPDDIETTLSIIDRMEELDRFPNERMSEQVTDARVIAQLAFDRDVAAGIMEDAGELIEAGDYAQAVDRYLSGFELQRERFIEREYPESLVESADQAIAQIRSAADTFLSERSGVLQAENALVSAISQRDAGAVNSLQPPYAQSFVSLADARTRLLTAVRLLAELRSQVAELNPEDPVDWHLRLISQFVLGTQATEREGIRGVFDRFLRQSRRRVADTFAEAEGALWEQGAELAAAAEYPEARERYGDLASISEAAEVTLTLATPVSDPTGAPLPEILPEVPETFRENMVSARTTAVAAGLRGQRAALEGRNAEIPESPPEALDLLSARRETQAELVDSARGLLSEWRSFLETELDPVSGSVATPVRERRVRTTEDLETQERRLVAREIETLDRIASIRLAALEERYRSLEARREGALRLLEGVPESTQNAALAAVTAEIDTGAEEDDGGTEAEGAAEGDAVQVSYRYPEAALGLFQEAEDSSAGLLTDTETFLADFEGEPAYVRESDAVQGHLADARDLLGRIEGSRERIAARIIDAESQMVRARDLREEGNGLISQARSALQQEEIENARGLVEEAQDRFFQALELQQDVAFRQSSDALVQELGDEILEVENQIVVRRTRQLVQQAEQLYDTERYQAAFDVLVEARDTWARTHANEPNPEVENLLRFVNAALSLEGTRELAETEPLYPVLSNYLYVAREDFVEAQELLEEGQSRAAEQRLVRADQNLTNVTAVRPLNWEARVLKLRILQLQNAENFDEIFERRFEDALDQQDENPQEALTALETLETLNPDYPGLQQAIIDLEIQLGIRPDPVTQAQIARSNELYQEAQQVARGGGQAQTRAAISLLEEAVNLNPDNDPAKLLLDELRIGQGGRATVALSSEDEQLFRRAQQLFVQNNVAQAYAIVQRLLQDENNQLYSPLLDLERRITARLGI